MIVPDVGLHALLVGEKLSAEFARIILLIAVKFEMLGKVVFVQKVLAAVGALVLPNSGVDDVMGSQLGLVDEFKVATIALDVLKVALQVVVDLRYGLVVGFSTKFARVHFIGSWFLANGVVATPVLMGLVVGIFEVILLM